jgi:catechol 2,3-dioxygenase-like lactoylglutathione lyase family enzyme
MRGIIHHLDLTVRNPEASFAFYDAVLTLIGYRQWIKRDDYCDWILETPQVRHSVGLVPARGNGAERAHDRYSPGLHHVAWTADRREDVDRMHRHLVAINAVILDAPAEYPQYNGGRGYYAVFFADPDGLNLEFAYTPPP